MQAKQINSPLHRSLVTLLKQQQFTFLKQNLHCRWQRLMHTQLPAPLVSVAVDEAGCTTSG
jgi:hypothetical protein